MTAGTEHEWLVRAERLRVRRAGDPQARDLVDGVTLEIRPGESVGLVGESGSGKTLTALAILDLLPAGLEVAGGRVELQGSELRSLPPARRRSVVARTVGYVPQNPTTSLNPRMTVFAHFSESLGIAGRRPWREVERHAAELLRTVGIEEVEKTLGAVPHELSGGLNQRVVIALALVRRPRVLIADEPTTALDVSTQAQVLDLLDRLRTTLGLGVLLVTHDAGIVADRCGSVHVMQAGQLVESGPTDAVLERPRRDFTRQLVESSPTRLIERDGPPAEGPERPEGPLVEALGVGKAFALPGSLPWRRRTHAAVRDVDLGIRRGRSLGIVGESGSGKTTLARMLTGLALPDRGEVRRRGEPVRSVDPAVQYLFQDPYASLDPRFTVAQLVAQPVRLAGGRTRAQTDARVRELLADVELDPALAARAPRMLSGGQRQRVAIARALALVPEVLIADEPVAALDVSVQATVLRLLRRLQREHDLGLVVVSHDLAVIRYLCAEVVVMRRGQVVERGRTEDVYAHPSHAYTRSLLAAVPARALRQVAKSR